MAEDMRQMTALGRKIEAGSFAIVDEEAGEHDFPDGEWQIVRRVIHATADFCFKQLMEFHPDAVRRGIDALRGGAAVVADVKMITVGLNPRRLGEYGCTAHEYISDDDVIADAKANNSTRAAYAMRKAHAEGKLDGGIVAVGNAPTALLELIRLNKEEGVTPALVIGVPVGFVNAAESKDELASQSAVPWIIARGRKGGSTIAVSIIHALLVLAKDEENAKA